MSFVPPTAPTELDNLPQPYLLFLGDVTEAGYAKTAFGLRDWAFDRCVGQWGCGSTIDTGLPTLTPVEAQAGGARGLVIGVASPGGAIPPRWVEALIEALEAGLDLVSGMHTRLSSIAPLADAARRLGRRLIDVRVPPDGLPVGTGRRRGGRRLLTVGTDCAVGKKYTALALAKALIERGDAVDFRASGQTGILIAGRGVPMDAVVADFAAGAAERLSPAAEPPHWDVVEGQGSLFHPAYAGVSLALLHGTQPDAFVVCHQPDRPHMLGYPDFALPEVVEVIELTTRLGQRTNPRIRCVGVAFDTSRLDADDAIARMRAESARLGLPVADPLRGGDAFAALVDAVRAVSP
ncbi:DUF1611 domain-containing protein [Luteibacter sp. SG786]|uniref:DUF1611 domain-containing protein n=1 Tax=Luteibacter sp. SG786 TaxID=2587130 RepID=UPI00141DAC61|nr:DUF1611 domain-containing protein [Luteibacter sp. SG786]NII53440.1 putative NAD-dependent epimerase/dehydratase family protein [Luteibacter sp. SG786]